MFCICSMVFKRFYVLSLILIFWLLHVKESYADDVANKDQLDKRPVLPTSDADNRAEGLLQQSEITQSSTTDRSTPICNANNNEDQFCRHTTDITPTPSLRSTEVPFNKYQSVNLKATDSLKSHSFSSTPSSSFPLHKNTYYTQDAQIRTVLNQKGKSTYKERVLVSATKSADIIDKLQSAVVDDKDTDRTGRMGKIPIQDESAEYSSETVTSQNISDDVCIEWHWLFFILLGELIALSLFFLIIYNLQKRCTKRSSDYSKMKGERQHSPGEPSLSNQEIASLKQELELLRQEKEEALLRLSEIAARKLKDDNTAIADLSTENRPTKIVEKYKELYDNEWTEAFGELTDEHKMSDREAIRFLLETLKDANEFCNKKYAIRRNGLSLAVKSLDPGAPVVGQIQDSKELPYELADLVKQTLKTSAEAVVELVTQSFMDEEFADFKYGKATAAYIKKCAEITWFMNVQVPPMALDDMPPYNSKFDTNIYSVYTFAGTHVDYLVWPVCRVQKGGLLLSKGILQPIQILK